MFAIIVILLLFIILTGVGCNQSGRKIGSHDNARENHEHYVKLVRTLDDLPFFENVDAPKPTYNRHHGQRKLFLAELQLLNYIKSSADKEILFVYTGAAPCMHLGKLIDMFPKVKFLLIDPNEFWILTDPETQKYHYDDTSGRFIYLKSSPKIMYGGDANAKRQVVGPDNNMYIKGSSPEVRPDEIIDFISASTAQVFIYEDYCTIPMMKSLGSSSGLKDYYVLFMSDIRTNSNTKDHAEPLEIDILWNCAQVYNWVLALKPDMASHKHRMTYLDTVLGDVQDYMLDDFNVAKENGIDFLEDFANRKFTFLSGVTHLQAWVSSGSSETRLFIAKNKVPGDDISGGEELRPKMNSYGIPGSYIRIPANYKPSRDTVTRRTPDGLYDLVEYDLISYDQKMLYHNRVNKARKKFENDYVSPGYIDHCFDCALEADIWKTYGGVDTRTIDIKNEMLNLHKSLGTKYGDSPEKHNLKHLHAKTAKVHRMSSSVRYPGNKTKTN